MEVALGLGPLAVQCGCRGLLKGLTLAQTDARHADLGAGVDVDPVGVYAVAREHICGETGLEDEVLVRPGYLQDPVVDHIVDGRILLGDVAELGKGKVFLCGQVPEHPPEHHRLEAEGLGQLAAGGRLP